MVAVNQSIFSVSPSNTDKSTAVLSLKSGDTPLPPYSAFYPSTFFNGNEAVLPSVVTCSKERNHTELPLYAESNNASLLFKPICGIIELIIGGKETIKSIELSSPESLSGRIKIDSDNNAVISGDVKSHGIVLDCGDGIEVSEEGTQFFSVPPTTYSKISVLITTVDGLEHTQTFANKVSIKRGQLNSFEITPKFQLSKSSPVGTIGLYQGRLSMVLELDQKKDSGISL